MTMTTCPIPFPHSHLDTHTAHEGEHEMDNAPAARYRSPSEPQHHRVLDSIDLTRTFGREVA